MNPSDEPFLHCEELACGYISREVLSGIRLSLRRGKSIVLLGPNGSGKSTLLKTLSKTLRSLKGNIFIQGHNLESMGFSDLAKLVAYVPQEELPPFRFTVRQVVLMGRMPLSPGFFDTEADQEAARRAMEAADCLQLADRPITEISGGERQRVLIARALAQEAPLLLLDEPTSHLDAGHQMSIIRLVTKLREQGRALIVALHDLNLAADLGEMAVLIHNGQIQIDGPTEEVLSSPLLDKAYAVTFERFTDQSGRLRVFATV